MTTGVCACVRLSLSLSLALIVQQEFELRSEVNMVWQTDSADSNGLYQIRNEFERSVAVPYTTHGLQALTSMTTSLCRLRTDAID